MWLSIWATIAGIYVWLWPATTVFDRWAHLGQVASSAAIATGILAVFSTAAPGLTLTIWTGLLSLGVAMTDLALAFLAQWHVVLAMAGFISVATLFYNTLLAEWLAVRAEWRADLHRPFGPIEDRVAAMIIRDRVHRQLRQLFNRVEAFTKHHRWVLPCAALAPVLTAVPFGLDFVIRVAASLLRTPGESAVTVALFVIASVLTLICAPAVALWAAHTSSQRPQRIASP